MKNIDNSIRSVTFNLRFIRDFYENSSGINGGSRSTILVYIWKEDYSTNQIPKDLRKLERLHTFLHLRLYIFISYSLYCACCSLNDEYYCIQGSAKITII